MKLFFRTRIVHPLFPSLAATPAAHAHGWSTALAGTFRELIRAASMGAQVRRAVYVLMHDGEALSDGEREALWQRFQVPVYVLLVDRDDRVKAWECEAHNGLHRADGSGDTACPCGRPGVRMALARSRAHAALGASLVTDASLARQ